MTTARHGLSLAAREHLLSGAPLTRLEAIVLFGVSNLPDLIKELRSDGYIIRSRPVTYAEAARRVNQYTALTPPPNLPIREIQFTEYRLSR